MEKEYEVVLTYKVMVKAQNEDEAEEKAYEEMGNEYDQPYVTITEVSNG